MCLAVPGKIISIDEESPLKMGLVSFSGLECEVSLAFVPEAKVDDYVVVHVGHAISILDPDAAARTVSLLESLDFACSSEEPEGL